MADYSGNSFSYNSFYYKVEVLMYSSDADQIEFDSNAISTFKYSSSMDQLLYSGAIDYTDNEGRLDKVFNGQRWICVVTVFEMRSEEGLDGATNMVVLPFLVDSVQVLNRAYKTIRYQLNLVSIHTEKCMARLRYSNYGKEPVQCMDILKQCILEAGFGVDQNQFKFIKSDVKIRFLTNSNDNLFSVKRRLFDKMYSYKEKDRSLKFVYYDYVSHVFRVFDLAQPEKSIIGESQDFLISQQQSVVENSMQPKSIDIGSRTEFGQVSRIATFCKKKFWDYDLASNSFQSSESSPAQLNNIYSEVPDCIQTQVHAFNVSLDPDKMAQHVPIWSNYSDVYEDMKNVLLNSGIVIDVAGRLYCRPGCGVSIKIDGIDDIGFEDSPQDLPYHLQRYAGYAGVWFVEQVYGVFDLRKHEFRQALSLIRNRVY